MNKEFAMGFSVGTTLMFALGMVIATAQIPALAFTDGIMKIVRTQCALAYIPTLLLFAQDTENVKAKTLANVIMAG